MLGAEAQAALEARLQTVGEWSHASRFRGGYCVVCDSQHISQGDAIRRFALGWATLQCLSGYFLTSDDQTIAARFNETEAADEVRRLIGLSPFARQALMPLIPESYHRRSRDGVIVSAATASGCLARLYRSDFWKIGKLAEVATEGCDDYYGRWAERALAVFPEVLAHDRDCLQGYERPFVEMLRAEVDRAVFQGRELYSG
jgi:hypothetical protein